jgi:shikimate 5-dehydrogenase
MKGTKKPDKFPEQKQEQPGKEHKMRPAPEIIRKDYKGSGKLEGKAALITGGDSGIGRAVAVHFAREGADIAIIYLSEEKDAKIQRKWLKRKEENVFPSKEILEKEPFALVRSRKS